MNLYVSPPFVLDAQFDPDTKSWFATVLGREVEAPLLSQLVADVADELNRDVIVEGYSPDGCKLTPKDLWPETVEEKGRDLQAARSYDRFLIQGMTKNRAKERQITGALGALRRGEELPNLPKSALRKIGIGVRGKPRTLEMVEFDKTVLPLWQTGMRYRDIAEKLNVTFEVVDRAVSRLRKNGLTKLDGLAPKVRAKKERWLFDHRLPNGRCAKNDMQIADLWDKGLSCSQIGREIGISTNTVISAAARIRKQQPGRCKARKPGVFKCTYSDCFRSGVGWVD